ncbi:hypothetical protein [Paenibacillus apis]|nr:hypothetical protein [Paenibacillus apis]
MEKKVHWSEKIRKDFHKKRTVAKIWYSHLGIEKIKDGSYLNCPL